MVLTDKQYINCLLDFLSKCGGSRLSSLYDEDKYRIEVYGNCIKLIYKSTHAVYRLGHVDEDKYKHFKNNYIQYLRRNKINVLINNING